MGNKRKAETPLEGVRRSGRIQNAKAQKIAANEVTHHVSLPCLQSLTAFPQAAVTVVEEPVAEKPDQADVIDLWRYLLWI